MNKFRLLTLSCLLLSQAAVAQKKPLDHSVYDNWQSLGQTTISPSGGWVLYTVNAQEGDGYASIIEAGKRGREVIKIPRASSLKISEDEKYVTATIKPQFSETRQARIDKKKRADMPKDTLAIYHLEEDRLEKIPEITSFKVPGEIGNFIAYFKDIQRITASSAADTLTQDTTARDSTKAEGKKKGKPKKEKALVIHNLESGDTTQHFFIDSYFWNPTGDQIVYYRKAPKADSSANRDGLYIADLSKGSHKLISSGQAAYKSIVFDDNGQQLVFLSDKLEKDKKKNKPFQAFIYAPQLDSASLLISKDKAQVRDSWIISDQAALSFNQDGDLLYLGLRPKPLEKDTTLVDFEHAKVDIWHWNEDQLYTQQLANLSRERNKSYPAVFDIKGQTIRLLGDEDINSVSFNPSGNGPWALRFSDAGRRVQRQWLGYAPGDVSIVSIRDGQEKTLLRDFVGSSFLSPDALHSVYYDRLERQWFTIDHLSGDRTELTSGLDIPFYNEDHDSPSPPSHYGIAGWSKDGKGVYINDKYDIWYFSFDGKEKSSITSSKGRAQQVTYRYISTEHKDKRERRTSYLSKSQEILLSTFDHNSKLGGLSTLKVGKDKQPKNWMQGPYHISKLQADKAEKHYIFARETYKDSPDLYYSDGKEEQQLSHTNPQQEQYNWMEAELVHWTTPNGHSAEGILYKPEDFDESKQYPVIAYFYETMSHTLYQYQAPAPTPSRLNIPYFVSNDYLVFVPDIHYTDGHPGKSAEEYINSGMRMISERPYVDASKLAIQGQSWGGYQVAHLITRTDMYAAAWAGAPVVNMTSAYGGIRWDSGMNRQFQYEQTQSRIGKTLWEDLDLYLENSPLFHLDKVHTPVAIMHNDKDGAVPWYQGIEMFTALRRLGKPTWLLNYNGDAHNLMRRENRKDIQRRQAQFFDHFLKGKPAAPWIESGVPAINKGIDWGF